MTLYKFVYRDGTNRYFSFENNYDLNWFVHNEGDSLLSYEEDETYLGETFYKTIRKPKCLF